jgi:photosystem II stability/assembly factor-like uncharacterized protein
MNIKPFFVAALAIFATQSLSAFAADGPAPRPIGGDRDAHGCLAPAGYQWCARTAKCERSWELAKSENFANTSEGFSQFCKDPAAKTTIAEKVLAWKKLDTVAFKGKQDDISFVTPDIGWYGNGAGKLYQTTDGGASWAERANLPGTFIRALGFIDANNGFLGNIGIDYFPGVTDPKPLYRTRDGGATWQPVTNVQGPTVKGICAIDILRRTFIDSGVLRERVIVHAAGRVGGPAFLMRSLDGGDTWRSMDLSAHTAMIMDVKFFDEMNGVIAGASDSDTEKSHARLIVTHDGGVTWKTAYESTRPYEITWKLSFPTREVGYATIQKYNPDPKVTQHYVAKTTDGGRTWREVPMANDVADREFGVGFVTADTGWVGTAKGGYHTSDGGKTWNFAEMGRAVNKIRIVPTEAKNNNRFVAYAIGTEVRKFDAR